MQLVEQVAIAARPTFHPARLCFTKQGSHLLGRLMLFEHGPIFRDPAIPSLHASQAATPTPRPAPASRIIPSRIARTQVTRRFRCNRIDESERHACRYSSVTRRGKITTGSLSSLVYSVLVFARTAMRATT